MYRLLSTTALVTALVMTPALAQKSGEEPKGTDPLMQQQEMAPQGTPPGSDTILEKKDLSQEPQDQTAQQQPIQSQEVQFVTAQEQSDWLASSLSGRTVYNTQYEALGAINDVILSENGEVVAVLIGVGGFLGIGEKDVGVNFAALRFEPKENMDQAKAAERETSSRQATRPTGNANSPVPGQAPGLTSNANEPAAAKEDGKHSEMIIVLDVTKEEFKAAPAFVQLGEEPSDDTARPATQTQPREPSRSETPQPNQSETPKGKSY